MIVLGKFIESSESRLLSPLPHCTKNFMTSLLLLTDTL